MADTALETRVAKLESDVGHIRADLTEIRGLLGRIVPRIDEMYGRLALMPTHEDLAKLSVAIRDELATVSVELKVEIAKRPTRRQAVLDLIAIVGFIGVILTIGARFAH